MPEISIFEKDISPLGINTANNNIVYVPGYANLGPINTPTLCRSLSEFEKIFGGVPYKFTKDQGWPTGKFGGDGVKPAGAHVMYALFGDYEQSFIYATHLLRKGLPVLFERVMTNATKELYSTAAVVGNTTAQPTGRLIISGSTPGIFGTKISFTLEKVANDDDDERYKLTIIYKLDEYGISNLSNRSFTFSLNKTITQDGTVVPNEYYYSKLNFSAPYVTIEFDGNPTTFSEITTAIALGCQAEDEDNAEEFSVGDMYDILANADGPFHKLTDKGAYQLSFITAGGYPVFEYDNNNTIAKLMLRAAGDRGDAIAIIDYVHNDERELVGENSVYNSLQSLPSIPTENADRSEDARNYGAMYAPYGTYSVFVDNNPINLIFPASLGYLSALGISVKTNASWYAVAGVTRGFVPDLIETCQSIGTFMSDSLTKRDGISINPIINIREYGYCIYGNRTLHDNRLTNNNLVASSYMNIRMLTNDVKKQVYKAAQKLTFELDTNITWLRFKAEVEPLLERMKSGNGLRNYSITRKRTDKKATIEAVIRLYAIEAIEDWDITIELSDTTILVQ